MNARDLTIFFAGQYKERYGSPFPIAWTKHPSMFKRLLTLYTADQLKELITIYMTRNDPFAEKVGHTVEVFISSLPGLIAASKRTADTQPPATPSTDYERLEAARLELGRSDSLVNEFENEND